VLHLFAMAQIQGTHWAAAGRTSGAPNSVWPSHLSGATWKRGYTPLQWMKDITPVILEIMAALTAVIYLENALLRWLH